jgi:hypothetical protein
MLVGWRWKLWRKKIVEKTYNYGSHIPSCTKFNQIHKFGSIVCYCSKREKGKTIIQLLYRVKEIAPCPYKFEGRRWWPGLHFAIHFTQMPSWTTVITVQVFADDAHEVEAAPVPSPSFNGWSDYHITCISFLSYPSPCSIIWQHIYEQEKKYSHYYWICTHSIIA